MSRDTILLIAGLLVTLLFGLYSAFTSSDSARAVLFLPLVSVLLSFVLLLHLVAEAEARLQRSLDRRLPVIEYLESKDQVEKELRGLAASARTFVAATGGRGDDLAYLSAIAEKAQCGDIDYWRILLSEEITHEMCEHIRSLLPLSNVSVSRVSNSDYGNMLVVDSGFLVAMPVPGKGGLTGLKVPNVKGAQRLFRYLMLVSQKATKISMDSEVRRLCRFCNQQAQVTAQSM